MSTPGLRLALVSMHTDPFTDPGSGDVGGMNVVVKHGALALAELGHQVQVFTRRTDPHAPARTAVDGLTLHRVDAGPARPSTKTEQEGYIPAFTQALARAGAEAAAAGQGWDAIHSHHWFSGAAALPISQDLQIAHVQSFHSIASPVAGEWGLGEQPEGPGRVPAEAHLSQQSQAIIAVSRAEAATVRKIGGPPERIHVVTPGVDHAVFHPGACEADPFHLQTRQYVLAAARLEPLKGIDLAIEALARIPLPHRPRLVISGAPAGGYPHYDHELHDLVQARGLQQDVWFAGPMARAELAHAMRGAAAVIIPSHSETYGLVALEASACGVPVLASRVGGLEDAVVEGVTGILLPDRDPQLWANTIGDLIADPVRRARLGRAGTEHARRFSWEAMADSWTKIYRSLLAHAG